jgi:ketosteroid isomerase-like protein
MATPGTRRRPSTPHEMHAIFKDYLEAGDLEGIVSLYEDGAAMPNNEGQTVTGLAAIRENMSAFVAMQAKITFEPATVLQAGDIALVHARWSAKGSGPDGPIEFAGVTSEVVRRQSDGTWLYLVDDPGIGASAP